MVNITRKIYGFDSFEGLPETEDHPRWTKNLFKYNQNKFSFTVSLTDFKNENINQFRYRLDGFENKYAYSFIAFGVMVLCYVLYSEMFLNNPREFPDDLIKHVIAQKAIAFWIMFAIYIYSIGLGK